ncbi:MAG: hypothetical protein AB8G15_06375 [Saprospiraceae bacterium]
MNIKKKKSELIKAVHEIDDAYLLHRLERVLQKNDQKLKSNKKIVDLSNLAKMD